MLVALTGAPDARQSLLFAAESALAANDRSLTVGLDGLASLDAAAMSSLIVALRRMREAGGSVMLLATRPELLQALAVSGLDRVFRVVGQIPGPAVGAEKRPTSPKRAGAREIAGGVA